MKINWHDFAIAFLTGSAFFSMIATLVHPLVASILAGIVYALVLSEEEDARN